jgi:4-aminobutyrate aminotransferase-like enzyme
MQEGFLMDATHSGPRVVEFADGGQGALVTSVYRDLLEREFAVGCKPAANLLRFYPPLIVGEEDIAGLLGRLDEVLTARG